MRFRPPIWLIIMLIVGFGLMATGGYEFYQYERFQGKVERTTGRIEQLKHGSGRRSHSKVTYHYTDRAGMDHTGQSQVAPKAWWRLKKGATIPIKYLPEAPEISRLDLEEQTDWEWQQAVIPMGIGAFLVGVGLRAGYRVRQVEEKSTPKMPYMR